MNQPRESRNEGSVATIQAKTSRLRALLQNALPLPVWAYEDEIVAAVNEFFNPTPEASEKLNDAKERLTKIESAWCKYIDGGIGHDAFHEVIVEAIWAHPK